mgnify:CR=1 FL=1
MTEILQSIPRSALPFDLPVRAFKPLTYGVMHLIVAISVAYALTQNWKASLPRPTHRRRAAPGAVFAIGHSQLRRQQGV